MLNIVAGKIEALEAVISPTDFKAQAMLGKLRIRYIQALDLQQNWELNQL